MPNTYINTGENFLKACVFNGLAHSYDVPTNKYVKAYPEVTGYIIQYFCENYDKLPSNIIKAGNKLVKIQIPEGMQVSEVNTLYFHSTLHKF